jgi:hypothetical protein
LTGSIPSANAAAAASAGRNEAGGVDGIIFKALTWSDFGGRQGQSRNLESRKQKSEGAKAKADMLKAAGQCDGAPPPPLQKTVFFCVVPCFSVLRAFSNKSRTRSGERRRHKAGQQDHETTDDGTVAGELVWVGLFGFD